MLKPPRPVGDGAGHQGKPLRLRHPRRETNPQSHGAPPEFAGLPKDQDPSRPPGEKRRGSGTSSGLLAIRKDIHVQPLRSQARQACRHRSRPGRRLRPTRSRAGSAGKPRHRRPLRRPRRHHGHQHRAVGAERRPRCLPGHRPRRLRPAAVVNGATHATTPSPPRRSSTSPPPTTSPPGNRSAGNDLSGTDLGELILAPGTYRYTRRPCSPARSPSTPKEIPTPSSSSRSAPS